MIPDAIALCHTDWVPSLVVGIFIFDCLFGWYLVVVEEPSCQKSTILGTRLGSHDFCIVDKCPDFYGVERLVAAQQRPSVSFVRHFKSFVDHCALFSGETFFYSPVFLGDSRGYTGLAYATGYVW
jgi:hypothetical protein